MSALSFEPSFAKNAAVWPLASALLAEPPDPLFAIPNGALEPEPEAKAEDLYIAAANSHLAVPVPEPLALAQGPLAHLRRNWVATVALSIVLHAAVAAAFLQFGNDEVLIAGGEETSVALLGDAAEDQSAAGDPAQNMEPLAAQVTLIPMLEAKAVETVEAEAVEVSETVEPVETVMAETAVSEIAEPVRETAEPVAQPDAASAPEPERAQAVPDETTPTAVIPDPAPEILATDRIEPVEDDNIVPERVETAQPVEPTETIATAEPPAEPVTEDAEEPVVEAMEEPAEKSAEKKEPQKQVVKKPVPEKKVAEPAPKKPVVTKKAEKKPVAPKAAEKAPSKTKQAARSGSGGSNQADARRGVADGQADGKSAAKSKGSKQQTAAGNAAVSNYPGKIVSKLRRSLRYPPEARSQKLRGEVQVQFTVTAGGGVGSVRVVRSSGSPVLDKAALETVRRAAPFPAIPKDAGRSSWPFTVPLAFAR